MAVAALFNALERTFAPQDVIARQRDELLNLSGKYDSDAAAPQPPATPAPPAPPAAQPTSGPDKAWLIHQAQGTIGPMAVSGSTAPGGRSIEPDWPTGSQGAWSPMDDMNDPYSGLKRRGAEEDAWNMWAERHDLDRKRETDLDSKETLGDMFERSSILQRDPRWNELPLTWPDDKKRKAIMVMRGMSGG